MRASPLSENYRNLGATLTEEAGWELAGRFGAVQEEVEAAVRASAVADLSHWGHFTLSGANARKFLQGLVSNDVIGLEGGSGCHAAILNTKGRIETDCHIFSFGDELLIQVPPETVEWTEAFLGRFRLAGGFDLRHLDASWGMITVFGPAGRTVLEQLVGLSLTDFGPLACREADYDGSVVRLLGVRRSSSWSVDVVGEVTALSDLWRALVSTDERRARPIGLEAVDAVRVEAGLSRFARDFDNDTVLQEIDDPEIYSLTKGCYLGQEIVARLHYQGQPSRLLRRLELDEPVVPERGTSVTSESDDTVAGRVTSAVLGSDGRPHALASLKRRIYAPGTRVRVHLDGRSIFATVRPLSGDEKD